MNRPSKRPRQKFDPRKYSAVPEQHAAKERDWTFEDIVRSKRGRK